MYRLHNVHNDDIKIIDIFRKTIGIFCMAIVYTALALALLCLVLGLKPLIVISGSMTPVLIENRDIVIVQSVSSSELKVGDIINFGGKNGTISCTHRIIEISEAGVRTQGDAVGTPDQSEGTYKSFSDINGRVVVIYKDMALAYDFIKDNIMALIILILVVTQFGRFLDNESYFSKYAINGFE